MKNSMVPGLIAQHATAQPAADFDPCWEPACNRIPFALYATVVMKRQ